MQQNQELPQSPAPFSSPERFAVLLANQKAGSFSKNAGDLEEMVARLREQGWRIDFHHSTSIDDTRRRARAAVEQGADLVIAVGGDGTINAVIQELAGSETALGVIPGGTFNVWARETGIPLDLAGAQDVLLHGKIRQIDLGRVHDHYFLLMAGIGFGGNVTYTVKKEKRKYLGMFGYLLTGIRLAFGFEGFRAELSIDGQIRRERALQIVIGNTRLYGSLLRFTWRARCDDGLLDVCVVRTTKKLERIVLMLDFLLQRQKRRRWVSYFTCRSIEVRMRKPVNIQVDGEPLGRTPASFAIVPGALKVVVPEHTPEALFSQE